MRQPFSPVDLDGGFYYPPTVLTGVGNADDIARAEVFGPVVAAIPFEDGEHAIALANDTAYGLAGAVWTGSLDRAHRVARTVRAGTVWINSYKTINVMSPFGGFGDSGYGRSSGRDGLAEYTQSQVHLVRNRRRRSVAVRLLIAALAQRLFGSTLLWPARRRG